MIQLDIRSRTKNPTSFRLRNPDFSIPFQSVHQRLELTLLWQFSS